MRTAQASGLGIAKAIIEAHNGGEIAVESEMGKACMFTVRSG
jgi:signal transduction histidine kinase